MFLTKRRIASRTKARKFDEIISLLDGAYTTNSGAVVTNDTALRQSTAWACTRIISEIIAHLPIEVQLRQNGTWVTAEQHQFLELIAEPNDFQNKHDFISFLTTWSEMHGNSYYFKNKNGAGEVKRLFPIRGDEVKPDLVKGWRVDYTVSDEFINGVYQKNRIFHLKNFGTCAYEGLSTIAQHREGIGLALQLESHASSAYKNGLHSNKWIELESPIEDEKKKKAFRRYIKGFSGSQNTGEIPVLSKGKFHEFSAMSAVDAQYIESRKMQKQEIASVFGVPLFLLNDTEKSTTWGSGLEQITKSFIRFSLAPRLNRLARTFEADLMPENTNTVRIVFDTDKFTLGEFKERMDGYRSAIESGVLNPDECREMEDRNPRPDGGKYRIPENIAIEGEHDETPDQTTTD